MTAVTLRLPDSLHKTVRQLAKDDGVSLNQFITLAVAEKVSALGTESILEKRAAEGDRTKFLEAMEMVADTEPLDNRDIPS